MRHIDLHVLTVAGYIFGLHSASLVDFYGYVLICTPLGQILSISKMDQIFSVTFTFPVHIYLFSRE